MAKLVRDKIPEIIKKDNISPKYYAAGHEEYYKALIVKLNEEVTEFIKSNNIEELADILEVVYAIAEHNNIEKDKLEEIRIKKALERGQFKNKTILVFPQTQNL